MPGREQPPWWHSIYSGTLREVVDQLPPPTNSRAQVSFLLVKRGPTAAFRGSLLGERGAHTQHTLCLCSQDAKFVEERRKQLQSYLRSIMNKVIQMVPEFAASPKKETLTQLMPFFV